MLNILIIKGLFKLNDPLPGRQGDELITTIKQNKSSKIKYNTTPVFCIRKIIIYFCHSPRGNQRMVTNGT